MKKALEEGDDLHIKGFILHKLYCYGCFSKRGAKHHGRHTSVENLPKSYPRKHRGEFRRNIKELKKKGLIIVFPSMGERHVCAVLDPANLQTGISMCNAYRVSVGLPPLDERFKELLEK